MDRAEMSNLFDVLYNNITSNQAPGLNEYEKSVFLTKAQDEIVKNYFLPQSNPKQAGFDDNPKRQIDFSKLIANYQFSPQSSFISEPDPRGYIFLLTIIDDNEDTVNAPILFIINESILFYDKDVTQSNPNVIGIRQVIPLRNDEYLRLMSKPFKEPLKYQAWRLITSTVANTDGPEDITKVCIVITSADKTKFQIGSPQTSNRKMVYQIRCVKRPRPIILTDLTTAFGEDLTIHDKSSESDCELDPILHEEIVQRAVELAKIAWTATGQDNTQMMLQAGQRSE